MGFLSRPSLRPPPPPGYFGHHPIRAWVWFLWGLHCPEHALQAVVMGAFKRRDVCKNVLAPLALGSLGWSTLTSVPHCWRSWSLSRAQHHRECPDPAVPRLSSQGSCVWAVPSPHCEVGAAVTPSDRPESASLASGCSGILNHLSAQTRAHVCCSAGCRWLLQTASVLPAGPILASSLCVLLSSGCRRFTLKFSVALILFARLCFHIDVRLICLIIQTAIKQTNKTL